MGFFKSIKEAIVGKSAKTNEKYVAGLDKSSETFSSRMNALAARYREIDDNYFEELENILIMSDVGVNMVMTIVDEIKKEVRLNNIKDPREINEIIADKMFVIYANDSIMTTKLNYAKEGLTVILMVGVNGAGKTTTIGKLAHKIMEEDHKKVMVAAGDTFRAGAIDQLAVWAEEHGVELIDYNLQKTHLGLQETGDYSDMSHLNDSGARKVSLAMGQYLADTGLFTDNRQHWLYQGWQADSGSYDVWAAVGSLPQTVASGRAAQILAGLNEDYVAVLAGTPDAQLAQNLQAAGFAVQADVLLCGIFDQKEWTLAVGADRLEQNAGGRKLVALASEQGGYAVVNDVSRYTETGVSVLVFSALTDECVYAGVLSGAGAVMAAQPE